MARERNGAERMVSDAAQAVAVGAGGTGEPGRSDEPHRRVQTSAQLGQEPDEPLQADTELPPLDRHEASVERAHELLLRLVDFNRTSSAPNGWLFAANALELWRLIEAADDGRFSALKLQLSYSEQRELERRLAEPEGATASRHEPLPGFGMRELWEPYCPPLYLVKGLLDRGEVMVVFGESGTMKSFFVQDLFMHVSAGMEYCGRRVNRTGVLYVAAEGGLAFRKRVYAWLQAHGFEPGYRMPDFYVATEPVDLMGDAGAIERTLDIAEEALGCPIGVVVFDTLAANFGAGSENDNSDMQRVLNRARKRCGSRAIVLVHHTGHDDKQRERGGSALRGAADRRYLVTRPDGGRLVNVQCLKVKDDSPPDPLAFEWHIEHLPWVDSDGDPLASVVLKPAPFQQQLAPASTGRDRKKLDSLVAILREAGRLSRAELVKALVARDVCERAKAYALIKSAEAEGRIAEGLNGLVVVDRPDEVRP